MSTVEIKPSLKKILADPEVWYPRPRDWGKEPITEAEYRQRVRKVVRKRTKVLHSLPFSKVES